MSAPRRSRPSPRDHALAVAARAKWCERQTPKARSLWWPLQMAADYVRAEFVGEVVCYRGDGVEERMP